MHSEKTENWILYTEKNTTLFSVKFSFANLPTLGKFSFSIMPEKIKLGLVYGIILEVMWEVWFWQFVLYATTWLSLNKLYRLQHQWFVRVLHVTQTLFIKHSSSSSQWRWSWFEIKASVCSVCSNSSSWSEFPHQYNHS